MNAVLFAIVALVFVLPAILTLVDLAKQRGMSDGVKVGWAAVVIIAPLLGSLAYWIIRPGRAQP